MINSNSKYVIIKDDYVSNADFLVSKLQEIDYDSLPISEYNKNYIRNIKSSLKYHFQIYAFCLQEGLKNLNIPLTELTLIDYGGGSGFLSLFAKRLGCKQIIYIDINPNSVHTVKILKEKIGIGPDIILNGDSKELVKWCRESHINPHLLIATDLIEHIYNLDSFFADLTSIGNMNMVFSTGSTPYNPIVKRKLRKIMIGCDTGSLENPNYYTLRNQYIRKMFPALSEKEVIYWTEKTRGLMYADIRKAVSENETLLQNDSYNTCDPETGNWIERILPIKAYENILAKYNYRLTVEKGFYNSEKEKRSVSFISKLANKLIRHTGKFGLYFSPIIFLSCRPENKL